MRKVNYKQYINYIWPIGKIYAKSKLRLHKVKWEFESATNRKRAPPHEDCSSCSPSQLIPATSWSKISCVDRMFSLYSDALKEFAKLCRVKLRHSNVQSISTWCLKWFIGNQCTTTPRKCIRSQQRQADLMHTFNDWMYLQLQNACA